MNTDLFETIDVKCYNSDGIHLDGVYFIQEEYIYVENLFVFTNKQECINYINDSIYKDLVCPVKIAYENYPNIVKWGIIWNDFSKRINKAFITKNEWDKHQAFLKYEARGKLI